MNGYRYTFFPNGITTTATGIADYIVIARADEARATRELSVFTRIYQNGRYRLYQRKGFLPGELDSRQAFIRRYGADVIGAGPKAPGRKKKHAPATSIRSG